MRERYGFAVWADRAMASVDEVAARPAPQPP